LLDFGDSLLFFRAVNLPTNADCQLFFYINTFNYNDSEESQNNGFWMTFIYFRAAENGFLNFIESQTI